MRALFAVVLSLALLAGCAGHRPAELSSDNAEALYRQAQTAVKEGNYEDARKLADRVREEFPFSRHAVDAELLAADAAFDEEKFAEAAAAYRSFEDLHPTHPKTPYANYRRGLSHMKLSQPEDRDQTPTRAAAEAFQKLLHAHPDGEYAKEARARLAEARGRLAAHEVYVARFYVRKEKLDAALGRLEIVVRDYPDTPSREEAQILITALRTDGSAERK